MSSKEALETLLAGVEAGQLPQPKDFRDAFDVPMQDMDYTVRPVLARGAYGGSLDAALALHNAVLPEWDYSNQTSWVAIVSASVSRSGRGEFRAKLDPMGKHRPEFSAARAWLIAIIKALIAECDK